MLGESSITRARTARAPVSPSRPTEPTGTRSHWLPPCRDTQSSLRSIQPVLHADSPTKFARSLRHSSHGLPLDPCQGGQSDPDCDPRSSTSRPVATPSRSILSVRRELPLFTEPLQSACDWFADRSPPSTRESAATFNSLAPSEVPAGAIRSSSSARVKPAVKERRGP